MKWTEFLNFLRGFVRPYAEILMITMIVGLTIFFSIKFASKDLALIVVPEVVGAGIALYAHYAGERAGKRKEDK